MSAEATAKIIELYQKYETNEYMTNRLNIHIHNMLSTTLEMENTHYNERSVRTNLLQTTQEMFIKIFLDKNKYYYLNSTGCFYEYANNDYYICKEDDIQYKLLSTISEDRALMDWKYKTKFNIIRQIKDRSLFSSTPNTATIQRVLSALYPAFFPSKNAAKYFLTVIGDNILKKQTNIRIIHKHTATFAQLEAIAYLVGITNLTNNFTSKYNDNHQYSSYRLLKVNAQFPTDIWLNVIIQLGLNLLCVATHYSNRYGSSDLFINVVPDDSMRNHILFLTNNTQDAIVDKFIICNTEQVSEDSTFHISWKKMHYIWKEYLYGCSVPNMMYSNALKQMLITRINYDEKTDTFLNITSKYIPSISHFLHFWTAHITYDTAEEFELTELYTLYGKLGETEMLKLIQHFFPEIVVQEFAGDKFILNVRCDLWDKCERILSITEEYRKNVGGLISIDDLYEKYSVGRLIASKQYFEKMVQHHLKDFIVFDAFLNFAKLEPDTPEPPEIIV